MQVIFFFFWFCVVLLPAPIASDLRGTSSTVRNVDIYYNLGQ